MQDAQVFGVTVEALMAASGYGEHHPDYAVWQDNQATLQLFLSCFSQWRYLAGQGYVFRLGLDYAGVETVMRMSGVKNRGDVFADIQAMEAAALDVFNSK